MLTPTTKNAKVGSITVGFDAENMQYVAIVTTAKANKRFEDTDLGILRKQVDDAAGPAAARLVNNTFRSFCTSLRNLASALRLQTRLYMKANRTTRTSAAKKGTKVGTKVGAKVAKKSPAKKTRRADDED